MLTVDFKRLDRRPGLRILDIGCGSGRHICAAAGLDNVLAVGADRRCDDLIKARERFAFHCQSGAHGGGPFVLLAADITALPFADGAFDLIICSEVMEHIPDQQAAVAELHRLLAPGGDLVVSVPRYLPERLCWLLAKDYGMANDGHIRIYRKDQLIHLFTGKSISFLGHHYAHGLHSPFWWLKCLLGPTRERLLPVRLYHRFLVWDMMQRPRLTIFLDRLLTPWIGKSLVIYLRKTT